MTAAKKGQVDVTSTSDNETPNPSGTLGTGAPTRRRYSDVVVGRESPVFVGGQKDLNKSGDEGSPFKDLDSEDKGNESDELSPPPDQNLN